jgi:hypothetical protein
MLQAWKESPEFSTLITDTNTIVKSFQLQLKEQVIKNIKLEHDVIRVKIRNDLCESLLSVVLLYLEALMSEPQITHEIVLAILEGHGTAFLRHVPGAVQDFTIIYRTTHNFNHDQPSGKHLPMFSLILGISISDNKNTMNFAFPSERKPKRLFRLERPKRPLLSWMQKSQLQTRSCNISSKGKQQKNPPPM